MNEIMLFLGGMFLNVFVLPTVFNEDAAVPRTQSIPYVIILIVFFVYPYAALGLYWPTISTFVAALLWLYVALYRNINNNTTK